MAGGRPAIDKLLTEVAKEQEAAGLDNSVTVAFQVVAPLLVESTRIQEYVRATDQIGLGQSVLLDLLTPEDAAAVGAMKYGLTPEETALLTSRLTDVLERRADDSEAKTSNDRWAYELFVDRSHVVQRLRRMRVPRKVRPRERAILGFNGSFLTVGAFDQAFVAAASGWTGDTI